jgi:hypothetical protein
MAEQHRVLDDRGVVVPEEELQARALVSDLVRKGDRQAAEAEVVRAKLPRDWFERMWAKWWTPQPAARPDWIVRGSLRFKPKPVDEPTVEAEAEPRPKPGARFAVVPPIFDAGGAAKLSKRAPYDNAKEFVARHCFRDGWLATYFWQDQFWQWNGRHYEVLAPEAIRDQVWAFLDGSVKGTADGLEKFRPEPKNVSDVLDALRSGLLLRVQPPMWLDTGEPATDWIVFRNGVLNVFTDEWKTPTPKLWVQGGLGYDWQPRRRRRCGSGSLKRCSPTTPRAATASKSYSATG